MGHSHRLPRARVRVGKFPPARNPYPRGRLCGLPWVFYPLLSQSNLCCRRCHLQIPSNQVTITHGQRHAQQTTRSQHFSASALRPSAALNFPSIFCSSFRHSDVTGRPLSHLVHAPPWFCFWPQHIRLHLASYFIAPVPTVTAGSEATADSVFPEVEARLTDLFARRCCSLCLARTVLFWLGVS
jgi:hypothetical protein